MKNLIRTFGTMSTLLAIAVPVTARHTAPAAGESPAGAHADAVRDQTPGRGAARNPRRPAAPEITESFTRTIRLGAREGFELATGFGQVTINGVAGDAVRIDAVKRVFHANRDAGLAMLQNVTIRIAERGGVVEALTEFPRGGERVFVDYTVSVPVRTSVTLRTFGGDIRVSNVRGELRVDAASGDLMLSSVGEIRTAKTLAGNVTITDADGDELNAETLVGTLQVRNVRADTMELSTISGALTVIDARCNRCTLKTISGDIEFIGPLMRGGRYELQSSRGNIRLVPTGQVSFDLEARTAGKRLPQSDFPLKASSPQREGILRGSYGEEGGAIVSMTSFSGSVAVERK